MVNPYKYVKLGNGKNQVEHRVIMEEYLGRKLSSDEIVHHINGEYRDNRPENFELVTRAEHIKVHLPQTPTYEFIKCAYCGKQVTKLKRDLDKYRKKGTTDFYCNKQCSGRHLYKIGKIVPPNKKFNLNIDELVKEELGNGLTGYAIAKKHNLNKKTVHNHINSM